MYSLQKNQLNVFDLNSARTFVDCWTEYVSQPPKIEGRDELIAYDVEINIRNALTKKNVQRLLRWKDRKYLSWKITKAGKGKKQVNDRVVKVLKHLSILNEFRQGDISEARFLEVAKQIFPTGPVYRIFLFHICRPLEYPIADQHVFRVYARHRGLGRSLDVSWKHYDGYRNYFNQVYQACRFGSTSQFDEMITRKCVDSALMAFGQYLKMYDP